MTERGMIPAEGPAPAPAGDVVELHLLVPANQVSELEAVAVRLGLSVAALVRRAISDFLQSPAAAGFVGKVAGKPTAPYPLSEGIR